MPSPACACLVGEPIGARGNRRVQPRIDALGDNVCSAHLPGDGWARLRHDPFLDELIDCARFAGVVASKEVVGLFRGTVPAGSWARFLELYPYARTRRGLVPDAKMLLAPSGSDQPPADQLFEFKTT